MIYENKSLTFKYTFLQVKNLKSEKALLIQV